MESTAISMNKFYVEYRFQYEIRGFKLISIFGSFGERLNGIMYAFAFRNEIKEPGKITIMMNVLR